jgi:amidase
MLGENDTWVGASAARIARSVRRGDATATWVTVEHLDHALRADERLRALRFLRDGTALAEAELVDDQPDLSHLSLAGVPVVVPDNVAVAGLSTTGASTVDGLAWADHEIVRRLRGAGAIVLGTARTNGLNRNPWRSDRTAGGRAGGCAAAVAAGLAPLAIVPETGPALRIAAACCGLVTATTGGRGAAGGCGVLATTAADAELALAVLAGRDPNPPADLGRLRVGVSDRGPLPGLLADRAARRSVSNAARLLAGQGHDLVLAEEPGQREVELVLAPTLGGAPARVAGSRLLRALRESFSWSRAGLPAVVLPLGIRPDGLPDSVQLVGTPGSEPTLLAVARRLTLAGRRRQAPGWPRVAPRWDLATPDRDRATIGA